MDADKDIHKQMARKDGMTVPEGYFADFAARMADSLPVTPYEQSATSPVVAPRSFWQRVRPYAYMAAMFAGVWCMLKMFTMMQPSTGSLIDSPAVAEAMSNDIFVKDYVIANIDEYEIYDCIYDDLYDEGYEFDVNAFIEDLDIDFPSPELTL